MKRIFALVLIAVFILSLCACSEAKKDTNSDHDHTDTNSTTSAVVGTVAPESSVAHTEQKVTGAVAVITQPAETTEGVQSVTVTDDGVMGPLQQKHSDKIDADYDAEYQTGETVTERIAITDKYTAEWFTLAERYYNELLLYKGDTPVTADYATDEQLHEYIELYKSNFEMSFAENSEFHLDKIENDADQIAAQIAYSQFCYNAKREYAMFLIGVYEELAEFNGQVL